MAMIGAEMVLPLYIQNIRGESAFHSGLMLLPGALVMGLMMPVTGRIFDKIGARRLAITGMFILTVNVTVCFLNKSNTYYLYHCPICDSDVWYFDGHDACDNFWHECFTNEFIKSRNCCKQHLPTSSHSIGTAVLISVLTNVTKDGLRIGLIKTAPLTYRDQATNATLNGYHAPSSWQQSLAFSAWRLLSS